MDRQARINEVRDRIDDEEDQRYFDEELKAHVNGSDEELEYFLQSYEDRIDGIL